MADEQQKQEPRMLLASIPKVSPGMKQVDPAVKELGAVAAAVLGYKKLHQVSKTTTSLTEILTELNIEVLETKAVDEYMSQRLARIRNGEEAIPARTQMTDFEEDEDEAVRKRIRWSRWEFEDYPLEIPEEVLALAIQIKQREPKVTFRLHSLGKHDIDPFLSVELADEEFYIAAWDEPKFTGKLSPAAAERANLRNKPQE